MAIVLFKDVQAFKSITKLYTPQHSVNMGAKVLVQTLLPRLSISPEEDGAMKGPDHSTPSKPPRPGLWSFQHEVSKSQLVSGFEIVVG